MDDDQIKNAPSDGGSERAAEFRMSNEDVLPLYGSTSWKGCQMNSNRIHGAFIYARYSTENQNHETIAVQVAAGQKWCESNGVPILGIFADEAISGMKETRPDYDAMMAKLRMGIGDMVVIYDQSRIFRKLTAWFAFREELELMGVSVVCVTQPMVGKDIRDPATFITEGSMAIFNQVWALQSRQKTMEALRFMAKNGKHTGGKPALGYDVKDGKLVICEEEAQIVRRIFREYADGKSYREIIHGLNTDGLKTKRGNAFGNNSLHDLLKNEKYIGTVVYGASPYRSNGTRNTHAKDGTDVVRIENAIPAIVERDLFEKVQKMMAHNKHQQGGRPPKKREYPLKGKVFCAKCKSAMTISTSQQVYDYYKCSGKKRKHDCDSHPISVNDLEEIVTNAVRQLLGDPTNRKNLIKILDEQRSVIQGGAVHTLQAIIAERADITKKLDNAADAVLSGMNSPTILRKIAELEEQKARLDAQAMELKKSVDASALSKEALESILDKVISGDYDPTIVLSIVSRVEVDDETITIWTIFDTDPTGNIDYDTTEGMIITPGTASGVPIVIVTTQFIKMVVARKKHTSF
jgi:site-specific DNA recombinase